VRRSPDVATLARGTGLGPEATVRHPTGTRVALHWSRDDEFLFDADDRPVRASVAHLTSIRETNHA
jgi:hypothetical protein